LESWKNHQHSDKPNRDWKNKKNKGKPDSKDCPSKATKANLSPESACPVHGSKGPKSHLWGSCALNPENKDHKDLDKFQPKKGKGKPKPTGNETHIVEAQVLMPSNDDPMVSVKVNNVSNSILTIGKPSFCLED